MKIGFVNFTPSKYDVSTPRNRPLGGSESALCYLTEALARRGHQVTLFGRYTKPFFLGKVQHLPDTRLLKTDYLNPDLLVIQNTPRYSLGIKSLPTATKLIFWSEHAHDQSDVSPLFEPSVKNSFTAFVFVSDWQKTNFTNKFQLADHKCHVIRNAISPEFENIYHNEPTILSAKDKTPILTYTSTPFRGLELLLDMFPEIKSRSLRVRLKVFSSMQVYQKSQAEDQKAYGYLYQLCKQTSGVDHIGSISQKLLAKELKKSLILAYPNIFPETSCISVMEALAAGCKVVTSELGALPETTAGFASLVPLYNHPHQSREIFINYVVDLLKRFEDKDDSLEKELQRQVEFCNNNYTWGKRAVEWENLLLEAVSSKML